MPTQIQLLGDIIPNEYADVYEWYGMDYTTPTKFRQALDDANGDDVDFIINSPGGDVPSGSEIYTMIKAYKGKTVSKIYGFAASAASFAAIGADTVEMSPTGQMMIHKASGGEWGNADDHRGFADALSSIDNGIANAYELKTGKSRTELLNLMKRETWMDAKDAMKNGFIDSIMFNDGRLAAVASASFASLPAAVAQKTKNMLLKMKGDINMDNVTNQTPTAVTPSAPAALVALSAPAAPIAQVAPAPMVNASDVAAQERTRLQAIDAIAGNIDPQLVNDAKYGANPMSAEQLAFEAMKSGRTVNRGIMDQVIKANTDANVNAVEGGQVHQQGEAEVDVSNASGLNKILNALGWASQAGRPRNA